jgi:hypothetical protein
MLHRDVDHQRWSEGEIEPMREREENERLTHPRLFWHSRRAPDRPVLANGPGEGAAATR